MSYLQPKHNLFNLSVIMAVIFGVTCLDCSLFAQDEPTQGDDPGAVQDPFDTPDDPFELPQVPTAPGQDQPAVNPNALVFQDRTVDEKYAGWRQASEGTGVERLDDVLRSHWVMADDRGNLTGTIFGVEDADLGNLELFLLENGRVVHKAVPREDGSFRIANAKQGTYALVAWGDNAFFAFGLNIVDFNEGADADVQRTIEVTAVPNKTTINTDWIRYFSGGVKFPVYGRFETAEGEEDPPRLYGLAGQQLYLPVGRPSTSISSHQVIPAADGRLIGRVNQISTRNGRPVDLRGTRIMLLKDDDVYAAVDSDSYGVFEFPEVPAGEYSCVAVGLDGLGCIGITVAATGTMPPTEDTGEEDMDLIDEPFTPIAFSMMPSEAVGWLHDMAKETAYQRIISKPLPYIDPDQRNCPPRTGGGCCRERPVRPGGYRPPFRSEVPREETLPYRWRRASDRIFNPDRGTVPNTGGYGTGYNGYGGTYNGYGATYNGYGATYNGYSSGGSFGSAPSRVPAAAPAMPTPSGSSTRNVIPTPTRSR